MSNIVKNPIIVTSGGSGEGVLIEKTVPITDSGSYTFNPKNDNADGYSSVIINTNVIGRDPTITRNLGLTYTTYYDNPQKTYLTAITEDMSCIELPEGCNGISGTVDFANCPHLETLILPSSCHSIIMNTNDSQYQLKNLKNIYYKGTLSDFIKNVGFSSRYTIPSYNYIHIYVKKDSVEKNESELDLEEDFELVTDIIIPDGDFRQLPYNTVFGLFNNNTDITSIQLGSSESPFRSVQFSGFNRCPALQNIKIYAGSVSFESGLYNSGVKLLEATYGNYFNTYYYGIGIMPDLEKIKISYNPDFKDGDDSSAQINSDAFGNNCKLKEVDLSESNITNIAVRAFQNCIELHDIKLPDTLETIGSYAFKGCTLLSSITIPSSVQTIGSDVFLGDYIYEVVNLSSLPITAGSTDYGWIAYYADHVVTNISEKTVTEANGFIIDQRNGQKTLVGVYSYNNQYSYQLPTGITGIYSTNLGNKFTRDMYQLIIPSDTIGNIEIGTNNAHVAEIINYSSNANIVSWCNARVYSDISSSTLRIVDHCICAKYESNFVLYDAVFGLEPGYCTRSLVLTDPDVTIIIYEAFKYMPLDKVDLIQTNITTIDGTLSSDIYVLRLPSTLTNLSSNPFGSGIKTMIEFGGTVEQWLSLNNRPHLDGNQVCPYNDNGTIIAAGTYKFNGSTLVNLYIPNTITSLNQNEFARCSTLKTLTFESNSTCSVGRYAFRDCSNLYKINFNTPSGVSLGEGSFSSCGITSLYIPNGVTVSAGYSQNSFVSCPLDNITVDPNHTVYTAVPGSNCIATFNQNTNTYTILVGSNSMSLASFGNANIQIQRSAIIGLNNLTTLKSSKVVSLDSYSCMGCENLTEIDFTGSTFTYVYAINNCPSLRKVVLPKTLTSISGYEMFQYCAALESLYLLNLTQVVTIGSNTFSGLLSNQNNHHLDVYVKEDLISAYENDSNWSNYSDYITFKAATNEELGIDYQDLEPDYSTLYVGMEPIIYGIKENGDQIQLDNSIDLTFNPALSGGTFGSDGDYTITLTGTTLSVDYYVEPEEEEPVE